MLDVTIVHPHGTPTFWDLLSGRLDAVLVRVQQRDIPAEVLGGDPVGDKALPPAPHGLDRGACGSRRTSRSAVCSAVGADGGRVAPVQPHRPTPPARNSIACAAPPTCCRRPSPRRVLRRPARRGRGRLQRAGWLMLSKAAVARAPSCWIAPGDVAAAIAHLRATWRCAAQGALPQMLERRATLIAQGAAYRRALHAPGDAHARGARVMPRPGAWRWRIWCRSMPAWPGAFHRTWRRRRCAPRWRRRGAAPAGRGDPHTPATPGRAQPGLPAAPARFAVPAPGCRMRAAARARRAGRRR